MGEHKHNPTAQLVRSGQLRPKQKPMSKRKSEAVINNLIREKLGINKLESEMTKFY